jgi:hypothetical protein
MHIIVVGISSACRPKHRLAAFTNWIADRTWGPLVRILYGRKRVSRVTEPTLLLPAVELAKKIIHGEVR